MAFRHARTDDPSNASANTRTRILERLLIQHAEEGLELIELRRQMGKSGYVPTPHYWQNDGNGDDLSDDDGTFLLIGGMAPIDLAVEIVEAARQFTEETGEHKNYRVVAYRSIPQDPEEQAEDAFTFSLPASMFSTPEEIGHSDASKEQHDAMMAMTQQFARQNETLFRMLMDVVRQYPAVLGKTTMLMEQLGDQIGGGRDHDMQQVLAILEFESRREERWMDHDRVKQRSGHRADLLSKSIEVAGPDLMQVIKEGIQRMTRDAAEGPTVDATATEPGEAPRPGSAFAAELDAVLSAVPEHGLGKAQELLTKDEWRLIQSARRATSDLEFMALFGRLRSKLLERTPQDVQALEGQLLMALGPSAAMALKRFLDQLNAHKARSR